MSNKKNSFKQKCLTETQRLKIQKMLLEMQKEISELEKQIKHANINNTKVYTIRGLKIALTTGQLIAPFAVAAGIAIGGLSFGAGNPFSNECKKNLHMMKEVDSLGNIRYEQQYEYYEHFSNSIFYYGKWNYAQDNLYSRDIEIYKTDNMTEEQMLKLINGNIEILREVLGEPILKKKETKNNLSEEELQKEPFLQAIIYSSFEDDFIMVKLSFGEKIKLMGAYACVVVISEFFPYLWRENFSKFDYMNCISNIKKKHPTIDVEELTKKLEIKKSNYNRLTR